MAVKVSSTIKLNEAKLKELTRQQYISLAQTADALITDIRDEQLMPFDTGNLQNDSTFVDTSKSGTVSIVTTAPQARRLYFHPEYNYKRNNNANAGGKWFESFLNDDFIKKAYGTLLKQRGRI